MQASADVGPIYLLCPRGFGAQATRVRDSLRSRGQPAEIVEGADPEDFVEAIEARPGVLHVICRFRDDAEQTEKRVRFHVEQAGVAPSSICTVRVGGLPPGSVADQIQAEMLREEPDLEDQVTQRVPDDVFADLVAEVESNASGSRRAATQIGMVPPSGPATTAPPPRPRHPSQAPGLPPADSEPDGAAFLADAAQRRRWAIVGASGLGLLLLALAFGLSGDDADADDAAVVAKAKEPGTKVGAPEPAAEPARTVEAAPEPELEPEREPEPEPKPSIEPAPEPPAETVEEEPVEDVEPKVEPEPALPAEQEAINTALRKRKIRSLDTMLISRPNGTRRDWAGAVAYCEALDVNGIAGWRLPEVGELVTLKLQRLIGRRVYWTSTEGDSYGERRLAYNGKRRRIVPIRVKWRGGRTVCVRER